MEDTMNGLRCWYCGVYFTKPNGYPVACEHCRRLFGNKLRLSKEKAMTNITFIVIADSNFCGSFDSQEEAEKFAVGIKDKQDFNNVVVQEIENEEIISWITV